MQHKSAQWSSPRLYFCTEIISYPLAFYIALCQYIVMVCIYCGHKTKVNNSRGSKAKTTTWRRRECLTCHAIATTIETYELQLSHRVSHSDKSLRPFLRDRIYVDVFQSLSHRKSAITDATALTDTIITSCLRQSQRGIIQSSAITKVIHETLQKFDNAAAIYFSSRNQV